MCDCQKNSVTKPGSYSSEPIASGDADFAGQLRSEVDKLGRQAYRRQIGSAARRALTLLPESEEVEKLDSQSKLFVERVSALISEGLDITRMPESRMESFAAEIAWANMAASIAAAAMAKDNGGGGGSGKTCVTKCADEYDQCVRENNCDTGGWICLCCSPCSLQYMGCVAKCVTVGGGFGGVVIA